MATRTVRFGHYLAYGSNDFLGAGAMSVISGWILFFYTTFCGLTAVQAAAIFAIARLFDAVASPLIGYLSDHFHRTALGRRFGRRRFFILLAVPLLPSFALMWIDGMSFWYYLVTYVFFEVVYAMELIPYETLAAEMSPDYKVKAKFAGARILCGQVAAILAGVLPGRIIEAFGKSSAETFFYLGVIFSVIFMLVALAVFTFTWERPREEIESIAVDHGDQSPLLTTDAAVLRLDRDAAHPRLSTAPGHVPRRLHQPGHFQCRVHLLHRVRDRRQRGHRVEYDGHDGVRSVARRRRVHSDVPAAASRAVYRIAVSLYADCRARASWRSIKCIPCPRGGSMRQS